MLGDALTRLRKYSASALNEVLVRIGVDVLKINCNTQVHLFSTSLLHCCSEICSVCLLLRTFRCQSNQTDAYNQAYPLLITPNARRLNVLAIQNKYPADTLMRLGDRLLKQLKATITTHYKAIQYNTIQYNTMQYSTVQYNTIFVYCKNLTLRYSRNSSALICVTTLCYVTLCDAVLMM